MLALLFGLVLVGIVTALLLVDMDRKRRLLADLLDRFEPVAPRARKLALRNLRRLCNSLFYAHNLMAGLDRELVMVEREMGLEDPDLDNGRFAFLVSRRLANMRDRVQRIETAVGSSSAAAGNSKPGTASAVAAPVAEPPSG